MARRAGGRDRFLGQAEHVGGVEADAGDVGSDLLDQPRQLAGRRVGVGLDVEPAVESRQSGATDSRKVACGVELRLPGQAGVEARGRAAHVDAQLASAERAPGPQQPLEARPELVVAERQRGRRGGDVRRVDGSDADLEVEPRSSARARSSPR